MEIGRLDEGSGWREKYRMRDTDRHTERQTERQNEMRWMERQQENEGSRRKESRTAWSGWRDRKTE